MGKMETPGGQAGRSSFACDSDLNNENYSTYPEFREGRPAFCGIPESLSHLAEQSVWVGWRWETRAGQGGKQKATKPPFRVAQGARGSYASNDKPDTWSTLAEARAAFDKGETHGVGLQLMGLAGIVALDLDDVRDPATGQVLPWAEDLIARSGSYAEFTPSGTGFRILGKVSPSHPPEHRKIAHPEGGYAEVYANLLTGRYITVTGARLGDAPDVLVPLDDLVREVLALRTDAGRRDDIFSRTADEPDGHGETGQGASDSSIERAVDFVAMVFSSLPVELQRRIAFVSSGEDRSAAFQSAVSQLVGRGISFENALLLFRHHADGPAQKFLSPRDRLDTELRRSWDKALSGTRDRRDRGDANQDRGEQGADPSDRQGDYRETIDRLVRLDPIQYDQERAAAAEALGIRTSTLDEAVKRRRAELRGVDEAQGIVEELEPWPSSVDGASLADAIRADLLAHVVFPSDHDADAATLWILGTYLMDTWNLWPKLLIRSPEKRCGKTTLLEVVEAHVCRGMMTANTTAAALFRSIEKWSPTLLIDEADRFLRDNEEANGIINAGHRRRSAVVMRCVERNGTQDVERFSVWGAQAIASIGAQFDTLEDRSIRIGLRRRLASEKVRKLPRDFHESRLDRRRQIDRWARDNALGIGASEIMPPPCGNDRAQDNWQPLWAIAAALGGTWSDKVASAYHVKETKDASEDVEGAGIQALRDVATVFEDRGQARLGSGELVQVLVMMDDRPWAEFKHGRQLTTHGLARLLKPFDVKPQKLREGATTFNGYRRGDVMDAFSRYCC